MKKEVCVNCWYLYDSYYNCQGMEDIENEKRRASNEFAWQREYLLNIVVQHKDQLQQQQQQYSNEMWKELIGEGDANEDGEITFEEFKTMMKKMLHK